VPEPGKELVRIGSMSVCRPRKATVPMFMLGSDENVQTCRPVTFNSYRSIGVGDEMIGWPSSSARVPWQKISARNASSRALQTYKNSASLVKAPYRHGWPPARRKHRVIKAAFVLASRPYLESFNIVKQRHSAPNHTPALQYEKLCHERF
jgi:hypothetical protein